MLPFFDNLGMFLDIENVEQYSQDEIHVHNLNLINLMLVNLNILYNLVSSINSHLFVVMMIVMISLYVMSLIQFLCICNFY